MITYDEYLLQKHIYPDQNYQIFDFNSLHEIYLTNNVISSDNLDVGKVEDSVNDIKNIFIKKFSRITLIIKNTNENFTIK